MKYYEKGRNRETYPKRLYRFMDITVIIICDIFRKSPCILTLVLRTIMSENLLCLPLYINRTTLCFNNGQENNDDFTYWPHTHAGAPPSSSPSPASTSRNTLKENNSGRIPMATSSLTPSPSADETDASSTSSSSSSSSSSCSSSSSSSCTSSSSCLWVRWMTTLLRFRKLKKKMLNKEMGCLQRLTHTLRRLNKVLCVYEGMSGGSAGEAVAAARDRATRYQSVQHDTTLDLPCQVSLPDGEEGHYCRLPTMKRLTTSDSQEEKTREYIKPAPNKTAFDVEGEGGPHRSHSLGFFPTQGEWGGVVQSGGTTHLPHHQYQPHHHHPQQQHLFHHHHHQHRYSASLDARSSPHPTVSTASSSSSSSSSSWGPGWGSGDESNRGSPRRGRKILANMIAPFTSPKSERGGGGVPQSPQDGVRRGGGNQHQVGGGIGGGGLGTSSLLPSHDQYCPIASTLADITMLPVSCGTSHSANYPSASETSQENLLGGGLSAQGSRGVNSGALPIPYEQSSSSSQSGYSASVDQHDSPPLYSEVIENPTLYRSVSRPSEQRTNSGKI